MKRRIHPIKHPLLLAVFLTSFFIYPSLLRAQTAQEYIGSGEDALFSQRIQGILQAYSIFQQAKNSFPNDPVINTYLALTRMLDLGLRTDGTGLTDLLGRYGIVRTGVDLESIDFKPPLTADKLSLPESAPSGETIRSFAAGEVLTALNASISNLDTTIGQWSDASKYIIKKAKLDSDRDIELDYGDIYLFRAGLKAAKAMVLIGTAYDQNVDLREVAALINLEAFNPKKFFDRYQNFLKLLPTATTTGNGAAQVNDARAVLLSAIDDYLTASTKIRNDSSTKPGAEELIEIDPGDPDEQLIRENMTELKNSLNQNRAADLVLERVGTQYHVYGGTSFSTTESFWWMKGFHPENYGYTFLGSATTTATFNGSYPYYIVVTRPGNVAPVDTVRGSNGLYYGTNTMWNASSWGNIGGPPDSHFGLIGNKDSEGYIVINPPVSLASITVMIVPEGTAPYPSEDHLSVNLNPFFANKPNLRDMLPSFSEYGFDFYPIAGTMGHGLGDDATLGGLFPEMTQEDWDFDIPLPVGPLSSVSGTLTVPGYDGTGPIYVAAFRHDGTFSTERDHLLGMTIVYPGQYTAGMTYAVSGLPVGEQVFIVARWDADFNGIKSGGDYLTRSNPLTVAGDGTTTANLTATTVYSQEEGAPYFVWVNVQSFNSPEGIQTCPQTAVADSDGTVPYTVKSLTVSGPSGFSLAFKEGDYLAPPSNVYVRFVDGQPAVGEYTFTLTDENGNSATSYYYLDTVNVIPLPDAATLRAYGSAVTPTLTWSALSNYQGNLFYRARIYDMAGNIIWTSSCTSNSSVIVPSGVLTPGVSYQWRLEALDNYNFYVVNNSAATKKVDLVIESSKPYFNWAVVFHRVDTGGDWIQFEFDVTDPNGSLPSSIQSCQVYDPQGSLLYTFKQSDYLPAFHEFFARLPGNPTEGIYKFVVTDNESNTVTTYDYVVKAVSVPMVDINTLQASGDPLAPTLSWGAPAGMDRPLWFKPFVDDMQGNRIWASPYYTGESSVTMPQGILQQGVSYQWQVRTEPEQNPYWIHVSNQAWCNRVNLTVNNSRVFFKWAGVYKNRDRTGVYTGLFASVSDPNGTLPGSIQSLTVTGPGGFNQNLKNGFYWSQYTEFDLKVPGAPQPGLYKFTVEDTEGNTAVSYDYVGEGLDIPLVDNTSILLTGNPLAPTVSWKNIAGYPGKLYYRLRVIDELGNSKYMSYREPVSALTIPAGILQPGESYWIWIEAQDDRNLVFYNTRSNSNNLYYEAPQEFMTAVSGKVADLEGRPIGNVMVQAFNNRCSGTPVGTARTQDDGEYRIEDLPVGQVFVRACASCTHVGCADEWYDWNEGAYDCGGAMPIMLVQNQTLEGIDFSLQSAPRRLRFFEVVVSNGGLSSAFGANPGYVNHLVSAVLSMPNPGRGAYEFDFVADKLDWDSDCRYLQGWTHNFGAAQSADYGDYTLTLTFSDGAQEVYRWSLKQVNVTAVDPNSIQVLVNDDGSAHVSWTMPTGINQYYEVRVRDSSNEEIYKSGQFKNTDHLDISASDLRCLEKGVTYRWLVRVYDNLWPLYSKSETREISFPYNPAILPGRVLWMEAQAFRGKLGTGFSVRPGSRDHVASAVVTVPNGFSYPFDLAADYFDMAVETRLGYWGWWKEFTLGPSSYGQYELRVVFDDGYSQTLQKTLNQVAVIPVDVSTMRASMLPDGAITFSWGWPLGAGSQNYEIGVRGKDGKEYYRSSLRNSITMYTAGPYDLRGLQPGQVYLWFVRAYDLNNNTVEQSGSLYFLYDPFVELLPGDLNGSGKVDLIDAIMAVQVIAGYEAKAVHSGRDVNGDGKIGLTDAIYILQQNVGLR